MKTFSCAVLVSLTLLVPLAIAQEVRTLKERLSDKASDAQHGKAGAPHGDRRNGFAR
jgi:hypothetical protein